MDSEYCNSLLNAAEALSEEDLMKDKLSDYPFGVPEDLPVDIRAKMTICLIHCKAKPAMIQVKKLVVVIIFGRHAGIVFYKAKLHRQYCWLTDTILWYCGEW